MHLSRDIVGTFFTQIETFPKHGVIKPTVPRELTGQTTEVLMVAHPL